MWQDWCLTVTRSIRAEAALSQGAQQWLVPCETGIAKEQSWLFPGLTTGQQTAVMHTFTYTYIHLKYVRKCVCMCMCIGVCACACRNIVCWPSAAAVCGPTSTELGRRLASSVRPALR